MNRNLIARVAEEYAATDISAENERIAELRAEIEKAEAAVARAETRCTRIAQTLIDYRGPDGIQVGDALLQERGTAEAARAGNRREDLEAERASLRAGIGDLRRRIEDWRLEIEQQRREAMAHAARLTQPLIDSIIADAKQTAEKLIEHYAALHALALGVGVGSVAEHQLRHAANGIMGEGRLLPWERAIPIPPEITTLLDALGGKGEALFVRRSHAAPDPYIGGLIGVGTAAGTRR